MRRLVPSLLLFSAGCGSDTLVSTKVEAKDTAVVVTESCESVNWYQDADGDGHGAGDPVSACEPPSERYTHITGDCDDSDASISPDADESCNGIDDDCNGAIDEGFSTSSWYYDRDGDSYGDPDAEVSACEQPEGAVANSSDCDDGNAAISPGATEICNDLDDDCNGEIDDGVEVSDWYRDSDTDGRGDPRETVSACTQPSGYVDNSDDCDDTDATNWDDCATTAGGTCSGTVYQWADSSPGQPELQIVSVYEADGGHGGPPGNITVDIDRPGNVVLVLSSYEPVDWTVNEQPGTVIDEVILNGYHDQRLVGGASGASVSTYTYDGTGTYLAACGYAWPSSSGGCDTPGLVSRAESLTGLNLSAFVGCYHGTGFRVE